MTTDTDRAPDTMPSTEPPQPTNRQILDALGSLATELLALRQEVRDALSLGHHPCEVGRAMAALRARERGNGIAHNDG
jgi:hypothetical protein